MKTRKDLAKYLADYLDHEVTEIEQTRHYDVSDYKDILEQGLEAFESTEDVKIMEQKVVISVCSGCVELKSAPENVQVVLHEYDLDGDYEPDNPDRVYGEDGYGLYEILDL